jgi:hypothetical protein
MVRTPGEYEYSSYRAFISNDTLPIVSANTILGMLADDPVTAKELYRIFVENPIAGEKENPFRNLYGGMILGSERFVREVLGNVENIQLETEQISNRKELRKVPLPRELLAAVSSHFGSTPEAITEEQRNVARKAFVYLVKKHFGYSNREIGELLGCSSVSAATKICQAFERQMQGNSELRGQMKALEEKISTF